MTQLTLKCAVAALFVAAAPALGQVTSRRPVLQLAGLPMASCPAPRDTAYDATVISPPSVLRTDRTAIVTVCLAFPLRLSQIASYDGTLEYSAALAGFDSAALIPSVAGNVIETSPGVVHFLGSRASGISSGPMFAIRLRLVRPGTLPPLVLKFADLRTVNGTAAMPQLWVQGRAPVRADGRRPGGRGGRQPVDSTPRLASLDRRTVSNARFSSGETIVVTVLGSNFDRAGNVVTFGPISISNLPSSNGSTIRFIVPAWRPSRDGSSMALIPDDYPVTVQTSRGTSNTLYFRIVP